MRVASLISLKQGKETIVEVEPTLKWSVQSLEDENRAIISIYNSAKSEVEAQIIILDITQSKHPMFESLDTVLDHVYSFPRFGLIFIEHLQYKIENERLMGILIGEIINEYFNGYVVKKDTISTGGFHLYENIENGHSFNYLNEKYVFFQNPSHMI